MSISGWFARERVLVAQSGRVWSEQGWRGEQTTHTGFTRDQEPPADSVGGGAS